jgi:hypothetical protein
MRIKRPLIVENAFQGAANSKEGCKLLILTLTEKDETTRTNRERIIEKCAEFYESLNVRLALSGLYARYCSYCGTCI